MTSLIRRSAPRLSSIAFEERRARAPKGVLLLGLLFVPLLSGATWAQSGPVIISGSGTFSGSAPVLTDPTGSVTVDWGVLDSLGRSPRPSSSAMLNPRGPIVLTPPKAAPKHKHKHKPRAVAKTTPAPVPAPTPAPVTDTAEASPVPATKPVSVTATAATTATATEASTTAVEPLMATKVPPPRAVPSSAPEPVATSRVGLPSGTPIEMPPPPAAPTLPPVAAASETASPAVHPVSVTTVSAPSSHPTPLTASPPPPEVAPPPPAPSIAPPPSVAEPAPPPTEAPHSVASLATPPTPVSLPASVGSQASIVFADKSSQLPNDAKPRLDAIIHSMTGNARLRAQIIAYAAGTADSASQARRLSLSRALAVRAYLIEKGVASTRLDVRALGHQTDGGSPDRVDIAFAAR